ncbi:hypothetical protein [Paraburkholderia tropica]|uniref:hypothetical protein n=1 Tax=Paraburkholderia tropica TaxID=92647 RepID=UPI0011B77930|nr:hypothetical protein [Paraburkholderia tropica]
MSLTPQRSPRRNQRVRRINKLLNGNVKKEVDETKKRLHNLVSLLLTQQRSKHRVVTAHYGAAVEPGSLRDAIFKNLQPISVGA